MKTVRSLIEGEGWLVGRLPDKKAEEIVDSTNWEYCPKQDWGNAHETSSEKVRFLPIEKMPA